MLGKSLQTRDRPETLFRVCRCARKCRPGHSGFQRLEDVASVAPSIEVKIPHLSTPPVHAGISVGCPYDRTMFECILVLSLSYLYVHAGIAVGCSCCRCMFESVLVMRLSTQVSLRPVPVAGLCGPVVTCFPVGLPSGAGGQVYLSWLYLPYGNVCDDRLRFDPLDR